MHTLHMPRQETFGSIRDHTAHHQLLFTNLHTDLVLADEALTTMQTALQTILIVRSTLEFQLFPVFIHRVNTTQ